MCRLELLGALRRNAREEKGCITAHGAKSTLALPRQFKKRAPRAVSEVKKFAMKVMGTSDVRVDQKLNKYLWGNGVKNVPVR